MRLCIPTQTDSGSAAPIHGHFGSAPFFTIYDTDEDSIVTVSNDNQDHMHGACQPAALLVGRDIQAVVCRGMGARALQKLMAAGIKAYLSDCITVEDIIGSFKQNQLHELKAEDCCRDHHCGQ
ncbi:MAG: NifB/NifX family molybdenum-iron cluster-binding protein [Candidatus Latescibacterota bacterium]